MGAVFQWIRDCVTALKSSGGFDGHPLLDKKHNGQLAEKYAAQYLQKQGLKLLEKNYATKAGEIDLIMRQNHSLVFVEVKYRKNSDWAQAAEAVTRQKQIRIIKAAKQYMQQHKLYDQMCCRFDVIAIDGSEGQHKISWIKHAFY